MRAGVLGKLPAIRHGVASHSSAVRADVVDAWETRVRGRASPARGSGHALHTIFLFRLSPKACKIPRFLTNDIFLDEELRSWWTTALRQRYDRSPTQFTHFGEGIDTKD